MKKRQVIVIGAGPAGSATANYLAQQGIDVLMLDKAVFPRDKPCGDVQISSNFPYFEKLGVLEEIDKVGAKDYGLVIIDKDNHAIELRKKEPVSYNTKRKLIDDLTCKAAVRAGAELIENFDVRELIMEKGAVKGVRGFIGSEYHEYYADITVIACGSHPVIARQLGFFNEGRHKVHYAGRAYYDNVQGIKNDVTETYYLPEFAPNGYIWLSCLPNGQFNVGVFLDEAALQKSGRKLEDWVEWWATSTPEGRARLGNATIAEDGEFKGWRISTSSTIKKNYAAGCILVGDAAAMTESFQGEGYPQAMEAAYIAGQFIPRVLAKGDFSEEALAPYYVACRKQINPLMWVMAAVRWSLFQSTTAVSALIGAVSKLPKQGALMEKATVLLFNWLDGEGVPEFDWDAIEAQAKKEQEYRDRAEKALDKCRKTLVALPVDLSAFLKK